ncbi:TetR family transcriptional regulator [Thioclava sp. SK-1]|uniref:TetR/AcrR family transcriptional regulator n=1 Tax=Thioclava sp. SK-1 TaxID=1889770 RepID=UPI000824D5AF|nr:TetR/AcrR family transcriptional regulator [Thioclava sp. SK-1]OCX65947.1 TetR family transcriptional regulator [Thioclava sp. SK-1]
MTQKTCTADASQIRKGRKFEQVLEGARTIFMRDGFEGASVDDIAREAKVSKATLYSYVPDKRLLFLQVATGECARQADEAMAEISKSTAPPEQVLRYAAEQITGYLSSSFGLDMFRICVAEAARFPSLGHDFYNSGPAMARDRLAEYLRQATARGEFRIEDFEFAAEQFCELCKAGLHVRLLCGMPPCCSHTQIERTITGAVDMFMARYGAKALSD